MSASRLLLFVSMLILAWGTTLAAESPQTLAYVGEDTLTTVDLHIELNIMDKKGADQASPPLPEASAALRRLIQNRLIIQEGYLMGLEDEFTVKNQVNEAVNARCMGALLDSVALSVPKETPDLKNARRLAVKDYISGLMETHNVTVDSTLLRSLDYGSSDPEMQTRLRDSQDVLAVVPTGTLTVAAFSRTIRFTAFHGLEGKPDADVRRDKILHEWVSEAVTIFEARSRNLRDRPDIQLYKIRLERSLMQEETLKVLLQFDFSPSEDEIEKYYQKNLDNFLSQPRVKMESLKFVNEEAARKGMDKLRQGAKMSWIKSNLEQVIEGPDPFPAEWFEANKLDLKGDQVTVGYIPDPYGVPGGWVLARVVQVQEATPIELAQCRDQVLRMMRAQATSDHMRDIISRLEEAVEVRVLPEAEGIVAEILAEREMVH